MDRSSCVIYQYPEKMMHTKLKCYKTYASPINAYKENQEKKKKRKKDVGTNWTMYHMLMLMEDREITKIVMYVCVCTSCTYIRMWWSGCVAMTAAHCMHNAYLSKNHYGVLLLLLLFLLGLTFSIFCVFFVSHFCWTSSFVRSSCFRSFVRVLMLLFWKYYSFFLIYGCTMFFFYLHFSSFFYASHNIQSLYIRYNHRCNFWYFVSFEHISVKLY